MGTRRSKHDYGRKPRRKDFAGREEIVGGKLPDPNFLQSKQAKELNVDSLNEMGEDDAFFAFSKIRWHETDGNPVCPKCGCDDNWKYGERSRIWKCKWNGHQFSSTSLTVFSSSKLSFKEILIAIALIKDGNNTLQLSKKMGTQYRGAHPMANKIRAAMRLKETELFEEPKICEPLTLERILRHPAYIGGARLNQWRNWSKEDVEKLRILADANTNLELGADALGRNEKTIAYKAREEGIYIPPSWAGYLPKQKYIPHPREKRVLLSWPFAIHVKPGKDDILIEVNNLVPRGIPDHMRGDICQDILLAIYEEKVNLSTLKTRPDLVKQFVSRWRKGNLEGGGYGMMSIDPYGDDKRSWEEQAAAKSEWDWNQMNDARGNYEAQSLAFSPPEQMDYVYSREVLREYEHLRSAGHNLSMKDVYDRVEEGVVESKWKNSSIEVEAIKNCLLEYGFILKEIRESMKYFEEKIQDFVAMPTSGSKYIKFSIPNSNIGVLTIRISDHKYLGELQVDLDTYKLGCDGVIKVIKELAGNKEKYESIVENQRAYA